MSPEALPERPCPKRFGLGPPVLGLAVRIGLKADDDFDQAWLSHGSIVRTNGDGSADLLTGRAQVSSGARVYSSERGPARLGARPGRATSA
jgi:hypothetical protein